MSSKSRKTREQHEEKHESRQMEAPVSLSKAREASRAMTERTASGGALSKRLAKQSLPLRRGQRGGTNKQGGGRQS
ncbi:hypothetical protein [Nonomuraea sp. NPDC046570]|uniref:hypothetical protein n=1 Tax=Nonomuraea sp. NPDC046570 TaxID=3155255 RepID=UPI0033F477FA